MRCLQHRSCAEIIWRWGGKFYWRTYRMVSGIDFCLCWLSSNVFCVRSFLRFIFVIGLSGRGFDKWIVVVENVVFKWIKIRKQFSFSFLFYSITERNEVIIIQTKISQQHRCYLLQPISRYYQHENIILERRSSIFFPR